MMDMQEPTIIPFSEVLSALRDVETPFHPQFLYRLSDLEPEEAAALADTWPDLDLRRRQAVMEDIEDLSERDYLLDFQAACRCILPDEDAFVRVLAVHTLQEYENPDHIPLLLNMMTVDPAAEVRAAAADALGRFVYLGEIEELDKATLDEIVAALIQTHKQEDHTLVRRRALEAVSFSAHPEIPGIIEAAFYSGNEDWMASALLSMGRSANARWGRQVLAMLTHDAAAVRLEAARATGELELKAGRAQLFELAGDSDEEVRLAAIWSLSQIGGEGVQELLDDLYEEANDEEARELIESALDNLVFTEEMEAFSLLELDEDDLESTYYHTEQDDSRPADRIDDYDAEDPEED